MTTLEKPTPLRGHKLIHALRERAGDLNGVAFADVTRDLLNDAADELERYVPPPTSQSLAELLKPFVGDALNNSVVILGDDEGIRVLSAYRMVEPSWRYPRKSPPGDHTSLVKRWAWLVSAWDLAKLAEEISIASGLSEETCESKLNILVRNRLIYPDGTISKPAMFAIEAHAQTVLGLKPKRNSPTPQQPTKETPK
jgi:hypothetical protein